MFNKNTYLKVEFMPDDQFLVTTNINKNTDPSHVSNFINGLITRQYLEAVLEIILETSAKNKLPHLGEKIFDQVLSFQNNIEIRPKVSNDRNPIIRPSNVMKQFTHGDENE